MEAQIFWNEIGSQKNFDDPIYLEKLMPLISPGSKIVEYGCGYGRLMQILKEKGYQDISGYDYAPKMIERGKKSHPDLDLNLIEESGSVPLEDGCCDLTIMSTILCCTVDKQEQTKVVNEMKRILKSGGIFYLSDFLICDHPRYIEKYNMGYQEYHEWGVYTTDEDITVRHHSTDWIMELLAGLDIQWFEQSDFRTMNNNAARIFHCIASKRL